MTHCGRSLSSRPKKGAGFNASSSMWDQVCHKAHIRKSMHEHGAFFLRPILFAANFLGVCVTTSQVGSVPVEISVLLGRSVLPMQQLLRMGRGAVIPLDAREH